MPASETDAPPGSHDSNVNDKGCCIIHNSIQLRCLTRNGRWRTLMKECPLCCFLDHHKLNKPECDQKVKLQERQEHSKPLSRFKETKEDDASNSSSYQAHVLRASPWSKEGNRGVENVFCAPPPPPSLSPPPPPSRCIDRKVLSKKDFYSHHSTSHSQSLQERQVLETSWSDLNSEASEFLSASERLETMNDERKDEEQGATRQDRGSCASSLEQKLRNRREKIRQLKEKSRGEHRKLYVSTECRSNATARSNNSVAWFADESDGKLREINENMNDLSLDTMETVKDSFLGSNGTNKVPNSAKKVMGSEVRSEAKGPPNNVKKNKNKKQQQQQQQQQKNAVEGDLPDTIRNCDSDNIRGSRSRKKNTPSRMAEEATEDKLNESKPTTKNDFDASIAIITDRSITFSELSESVELKEDEFSVGLSSSLNDSGQSFWISKLNGKDKKMNLVRRYSVDDVEAATKDGCKRKSLQCSSEGVKYLSHERGEQHEPHEMLLTERSRNYTEEFIKSYSFALERNNVEHDERRRDHPDLDLDEDCPDLSVTVSDEESYHDSMASCSKGSSSDSSSISDITPVSGGASMFHQCDDEGRCIYHSKIQLKRKKRVMGMSGLRTEWKVLLVNCTECCFEEIVRLRQENMQTRHHPNSDEGENNRPRLLSSETMKTQSLTSMESTNIDPSGVKYDPSGRLESKQNFYPQHDRHNKVAYNMNRFDSTSTSTSKSSTSSAETMSTLSISFADTTSRDLSYSCRHGTKGILKKRSSGRSVCSAKSNKSIVTFAGRDDIVSFCSDIWSIGDHHD